MRSCIFVAEIFPKQNSKKLKPDDQGYSREKIMKTLTIEQMEQVNGGGMGDCLLALGDFMVGFIAVAVLGVFGMVRGFQGMWNHCPH